MLSIFAFQPYYEEIIRFAAIFNLQKAEAKKKKKK